MRTGAPSIPAPLAGRSGRAGAGRRAHLAAEVARDGSNRRLLPVEDRPGGDGNDKIRPCGKHAAIIGALA